MAEQICQVYLKNYLGKRIQRPAHQRNSHYNGTIEMVQKACVEDVVLTGVPGVS